jgi:hypothetical protein
VHSLKVERRLGGTWRFHLHGRPETTFSSKTSIDFRRTTRSYISEDRTLRNNRCENYNLHVVACLVSADIRRIRKRWRYPVVRASYWHVRYWRPTLIGRNYFLLYVHF